MNKFAAVILAAGKGTRMKSDLHKVLHPIGGKPMLFHLLDSFEELSPEHTVVVAGDRHEQLRDAVTDRNVTVALQEPQLGTAHAALMAKDALSGFEGLVMVCFGDCPMVKAETVRKLCDAVDDATKVAVLGFRPADTLAYGRIIASDDGIVSKMVEHKDANEDERACDLCNSGVIIAHSKDIWRLLDGVGNDNAQGEYYLPDVATKAIAEGSKVVAVETSPDEVAGINSRAELAQAEAQWQQFRREEAMAAGVSMKAPDTVFFSWDTELGRDVTIEPHVVFGPGVKVADHALIRSFSHLEGATLGEHTSVGPYARLRPGAVLEEGAFIGNFVEMKKATLGKGAKASHLTYLGDATVGAGANIGAGTITCNYDGYFKHQTTIGERAFIGSNSALIAPVNIGADAIVAAGSAVSRDVAAGELRMVRAEQMVKPGWADRFHDTMKKKKAAQKSAAKKDSQK
ncbi:bifunctional UDP-N-acetylglucosamine diphosphorylase/glucosamine-1-phosphate N-acetyltransferase GlmU [Pontixanthobacter aestiaquae]|uniref:Bifunctional protein GlmU n=1 Tax=Pontixanthobacter aestiaquae TaxID=1509367 RepID=A0A844ZAJ9_9SPHN|nr:bifunctional UDP-N-acetylglucosamine diphosphorylase/glucosamine-1-phosphate N-acetyltransferase GlmU [Pontixanthobacter aestiaquae]MDN3644896.1 bifunctional UDP-N-acetylglucosamine diphosphorylase/glucosamine-1-phosphate N-acetyltransferase GlmU [Pontixanthobacter aestiaquae]MXO84103.1 bifunctional UDP-N-acetylglucosamine diphosphorylase/glucosamine-1-phosphate N-acetyltransferase GlmU [Pontixanthobacter aestiaquae]